MPVAAPYRSVQRVYFDDLDALNILHNVRYLLFIERARGEMFQALGFVWQDDITVNPDKWHVVAAHDIAYLVPVRGEGDLVVEISPTSLGRSSFNLSARVLSMDGAIVHATGTTRLVRLDPQTNEPCSWSDRFRSALRGMLPGG
jgi:acyl-CoA thioester hydrolase